MLTPNKKTGSTEPKTQKENATSPINQNAPQQQGGGGFMATMQAAGFEITVSNIDGRRYYCLIHKQPSETVKNASAKETIEKIQRNSGSLEIISNEADSLPGRTIHDS